MIKALGLSFLLGSLSVSAKSDIQGPGKIEQRALDLKSYLDKEKGQFESRESQKKSLIDSLDEANKNQNAVRQRLIELQDHQQELQMSLENLSLEVENQKRIGEAQKERLYSTLKVVYQIQKQGIFRFLFSGDNLSSMTGRIRVLVYTLKAHTRLKKQFEDRLIQLADSEYKLKATQLKLSHLASDLKEQQNLLSKLLINKKALVQEINRKQSNYRKASKEYQQVSHQLTRLFKELSEKNKNLVDKLPQKGTGALPLPVEGEIVQGFGKSIHEQFKTVTFHKGILIESEFNTPVISILPGTVEYVGWLKGLGNVMIIEHGKGLHTLSAQLFKFNKAVGEAVEKGEVIGFVGDTGNSEKPSLYFEVRSQGQAVDPLKYITTEQVS